MSLNQKGSGGTSDGTKLFWWPCPTCRLWHQTRVATELLQGDRIEVRCPVNGRLVERPITHRRPAGEPWVPPHRTGLIARIFRRFRSVR
ncbi:MAG: hypothetical protein LC796_02520 [Acidobacteria bacterium]|nr:hypothetical protein [Acidobacteriota bacterium]